MTPEAQRIAIAEACGWKWQEGEEPTYGGSFKSTGWYDHKDKWHTGGWKNKTRGLPDYLNDLNAIREAEKVLTERQELFYLVRLTDAMKVSATIGWQIEKTYHASAAQRAEAFLKTIGKWID